MESAQRQAAQIVGSVLRGRSLATLLAGRPRASHGGAEAPLVQELCYGTLRWWWRIEALERALFRKQPPALELRCLIGVAMYQLLETAAPAHAVVDQAVQAAARAGFAHAKGLVNGVLREFLRTRGQRLSALAGDDVARYAHPTWWITRLRAEYPERWKDILDADNARPPMCLRANRRRCSRDALLAALRTAGIAAQPVAESGVMLERPQPVTALPGFAEGWFSVQDAGAQWAARLLDPGEGMHVLDACAAPGGKASHLLETAECELTALDSDPERLQRLRENFARLGLAAVVKAGDARSVQTWWDGHPFDRILADVPCSSSGVARRHPDIKHLRRASDLAELSRLQGEIVDALWPLLARGGRMLYSTCSVFRAENAAVIEGFLARHSDARQLGVDLPGACAGQLLPVATDAEHNHDGFFYALLEKS